MRLMQWFKQLNLRPWRRCGLLRGQNSELRRKLDSTQAALQEVTRQWRGKLYDKEAHLAAVTRKRGKNRRRK